MYRTYQVRLRPTGKQRTALGAILALSADLYNAALQERRDAWSISHKTIGYNDQQKELTELRAEDADIKAVAVDIEREPLRRVDRAFKGFFRRCKSGDKPPGFPRFRSKARYDSFVLTVPRVKVDRLRIPNLGEVRFKATQEMKGTPKTVTIKRRGERWTASICCDIGPAPEKRVVSTAVGVDVGLTTFATLSDGTKIENPRWTRRHEKRIARANQVLARKQRRSKNRLRARAVLNRAHQRAADSRRNFTHHVSKWLVSNFDLVAYEDLNIKGMVHSNLAKSILDAAWGELIWQLTYKAENAGTWAIPVNPNGTTIDCSSCGERVPKTLADRIHRCPQCGLVMCRDQNAAINILNRGRGMRPAGLGPSKHLLTAGI